MLYNSAMDNITPSRLRANLKTILDRAADDHEVIVVERQKGADVVLLSREDYDSLAETAYLLRSPANASRLLKAAKRPRAARKAFKSAKALRDAAGL